MSPHPGCRPTGWRCSTCGVIEKTMNGLFPYFNISSIVIGLVTVFMVLRLYLRYRYKYLLTYTFNISLFNIVLILFLPVNYFLARLQISSLDSSTEQVTLSLFFISINILKYLWAYTFIMKISQLVDKNIPRLINTSFLIFGVPSLILLSHSLYRAVHLEGLGTPRKISGWITCQALIAVYVAIVYMIHYSKKHFTGIKRFAALRYYTPFMVVLSWIFVSTIVNVLRSYYDTLTTNMIIAYMSFNLIPAIFIHRFVRNYGTGELPSPVLSASIDDLFKQYGITKREQEIIRLICEGKSNKQIADELFISIATVKDHIYRIFQKTSVKSRIQLANLFR
jgi:DNA-binding CsgD family transcriptional regulator